MKSTPAALLVGLTFSSLTLSGVASTTAATPSFRPGHYVRPASCKAFPPSD